MRFGFLLVLLAVVVLVEEFILSLLFWSLVGGV
jgi:hypothetical protein